MRPNPAPPGIAADAGQVALSKNRVSLPCGIPSLHDGRPHERDRGNIQGAGHVKGTRVVADQKPAVPQQRAEPAQVVGDNADGGPASHPPGNPFDESPVRGPSQEHDGRSLLCQAIGQLGGQLRVGDDVGVDSDGKAVFNLRSDDLYNLFTFILSNQVLDQPLGLLVQATEDVGYSELDDRIYYTQGVVLVLRDFLGAAVQLYPVIREKGGDENIRIAFREMERVCTFDPLVVLRGRHDSIMADHRGKMASYVISIRERLNDVAQSIRR